MDTRKDDNTPFLPPAEAAKAPREPTPEEVKAMQEYAKRWRKRNSKKNAAQMTRAIVKKFGVQLT